MLSWKDISDLFVKMEQGLIASLKRNLSRHRAWEHEEGFSWPAWQAEKLRNIDQFRKENRKIVGQYADTIDLETRGMMADQFTEGMDAALDGSEKEEHPSGIPEEHFFGVNDRRLDNLMQDMHGTEQKVQSAALRMMDDIYRRTISQAAAAMAAGAATLPQAIDMAVKDFLKAGINCIEYKNGSRVNIADYVQMALRTAATRSYLQGEAKRRAELKIDTVLVSQYGACSKTCLPWQGRVYIDDVWGEFHGEILSGRGKSANGKWYPLLSVAVRGGLFHPNCRHTLSTWIEGVSRMPEPLDDGMVRRNAALEQKQRTLEKKVREYKRMAEGFQQPALAKEYRHKAAETQKGLRDFITEHGDILRRDYWREKTYEVPNTGKHSLEKRKEYAIIPDGKSKPEDVVPIRQLGNIRLDYLEKEFGHIRTSEIIITPERENHIRVRHPEDFELFQKYGVETVTSPDIVLKDSKKPGTVFMIRKLQDTNLNVVVRIVLDTDNPEYKNSVMTFYRVRDKNLKKMEERNKILYKKDKR